MLPLNMWSNKLYWFKYKSKKHNKTLKFLLIHYWKLQHKCVIIRVHKFTELLKKGKRGIKRMFQGDLQGLLGKVWRHRRGQTPTSTASGRNSVRRTAEWPPARELRPSRTPRTGQWGVYRSFSRYGRKRWKWDDPEWKEE